VTLLLADIGGTHVRFAVAGETPGALACTAKYPVSRFENLPQAVQFYAAAHGLPAIRDIAVATAAWPDENGVWGFSHDGRWTISETELRTHGIALRFIGNDFMASAKGAISASPESLLPLWRGDGVPANGRKLVIGPGTGLGIACAGEDGGIQETFGGHMAAAAVTGRLTDVRELID